MHTKEIENISEELFCINYETSLFAQFLNYTKLERWIPGFSDETTEDSHIKRYNFVSKFTKGKKVLDIACGTGRGSQMLAQHGAVEVLGADIDEKAIRYAKHRFPHENLSFEVQDATKFEKTGYFDIIVSFETIEHLVDVSGFLKNLNESLHNDGVFYVSTPISALPIDVKPFNVYHVQEWGYNKFQEIVSEFFTIEKSILQLYPKINNGRIANYWKRFRGITPEKQISEIYQDTHLINLNDLGTKIKGYQILQCKKKK